MTPSSPEPGRRRIEIVDIARGVALLAMAIFHFAWDLEHFGYLEHGTTGHGGWAIFARSIASSFLFLVGVGLVLAHGDGIRRRPFLKRLLQILAAAAAVTVATYVATPESFVYFGILQQIAVASVLGLAFLRLPPALTAAVAVAVLALPFAYRNAAFDPAWLNWIGLHVTAPITNDFVPIFPFTAAVLLGIAAARLARARGWFERLAFLNDRLRRLSALGWLGRRSLLFYLIHQPILYGIVLGVSLVAPPDLRPVFQADCARQCLIDRDPAFCTRYCGCLQERLTAQALFDTVMRGTADQAQMSAIGETVRLCSARSVDPASGNQASGSQAPR